MADADVNVPGVIEKLELTNFMCHANLALTFNPKINFIVGKNGSGKSAIMTSLMIVLGTKAAATSRGRSVSSFIRVGCNQARVRVTLHNKGECAYMPDKYGPRIVISRIISKSASRYTVETVNEGTVACLSSELSNILEALKIKLPNPFALMTQETMKTFFMSSNPRDMYELVREGTGIKAAHLKLNSLLADFDVLKRKSDIMKAVLNETEKEFKMWSEKKKILNKISNAKQKIATLEKEAVWTKVLEEEAKLKVIQDQLEKLISQKIAGEKSLNSQQGKQDEMREQIKKLDEETADWRAQQESKHSQKLEVKAVHDKYFAELSTFQAKMRSLNSQIELKQADKGVLQNNLRKLLKLSSPEEMQRREEKKKTFEAMKLELTDTQASKVTVSADFERVKAEARETFGTASHLQRQLQDLQEGCEKKRSEHRHFKKQSSTIPPVYGHQMAEFLREIDRAHDNGKFTKKPIGPIGLHVKVKDSCWELAVEAYLKSEFTNFFCNSNDDRVVLDEICNRVMPKFRLTTVTSKFVEQVFDVRQYKAEAQDDMVNLMDVLEVENPIVMNYLIDQKGIESILLSHSLQKAMKLLSHERSVPRNCKQVVTQEAEYLFPAPLYRYYSADTRNCQYLVKNKADGVKMMEIQIKEDEARIAGLKQEIAQHNQTVNSTKQELQDTQSQLKKIEGRELSLRSEIRKYNEEEKEFADTDIIISTQNLIADTDKELLQLDETLKQILNKKNEVTEKKNEVEKEIKTLISEFAILKQQVKDAVNKKFEMEAKLEEQRTKGEMFRKKFTEFNNRESQLVTQVEAQNLVVTNAENEASKTCPRLNTERSSQSVQKEIDGLNRFTAALNNNLEDSALIMKKVKELEVSRKKLREDLEPVCGLIEDMAESLKKRTSYYTNLMRCTLNFISQTFTILLERQHFAGKLVFDPKTRTLYISLITKDKSKDTVKNLSGGERSYTTIALILAVWEKMLIPFYMLDEFDVFMDMVNRRLCSDMLIGEAKRKIGRQFIFFTPQEMNMEAGPNITIHKLHDPRAN